MMCPNYFSSSINRSRVGAGDEWLTDDISSVSCHPAPDAGSHQQKYPVLGIGFISEALIKAVIL